MIKAILGKKLGMTHIYQDDLQVPVTVLQAGPNHIVQKKSLSKDSYEAVQIGFLEKKPGRLNKAEAGHFKKHNAMATYNLKEVCGDDLSSLKEGQIINCVDVFDSGDFVDVTATSKGKGFSGVMKRWNFHGGPKTHGSKHQRAAGSVGQGSDPSKVFKGMKMPGQYGNKKISTQNLKVVDIVAQENVMLVRGSVPGSIGSIVLIKKSVKKA